MRPRASTKRINRMKIYLLFLFIAVTVTGEDTDELLEKFTEGNIHFSANFFKEVLKSHTENVLICPISAQIILALSHAGAKGNTAKELAEVINFPDNSSHIQAMIRNISPTLQVNKSYILTSANKIFVSNLYPLLSDFEKVAVDIFKTETENVDFLNVEQIVSNINNWVEENTYHKIKKLINKNDFSEKIIAVLINALYFNGDWENQFSTNDTKKRPFYISQTDVVDVDTMKLTENFYYYYNVALNATFLELPFVGDDITMTVVLPVNKCGLSVLENNISEILRIQPYKVFLLDVFLPKFKMESFIDLKPILESLHVKEAFGLNANFSGLTSIDHGVYINNVVQKTFIDVNEKGATVGAATAETFTNRMVVEAQFDANHPFIYIIRHKISGILFIGKYVKPEEINY